MDIIYHIAHAVSRYNRDRKWRLFQRMMSFDERTTVLDVGFNNEEYFSDLENYLEKHYPYPEKITALGIQEPTAFRTRYPQVKAITYDGAGFPFPDKHFDICWSNAVLEHVGNFDRQVYFLKEVARVAKRYFITTPNRLFPIEVHTKIPLVHYLPDRWRDVIYRFLGKGWAAEGYMHLLSKRKLKKALAAAGMGDAVIVENRLGPSTLDFVITNGYND